MEKYPQENSKVCPWKLKIVFYILLINLKFDNFKVEGKCKKQS